MLRSTRILLAFTATLALLPAPSAEACTCAPTDVVRSWRLHDHAFAGTVVAHRRLGAWNVYRVRVVQNLKSCLREGSLVLVGSPASSATCGTTFDVGRSYVIFANDQSLGGKTRMVTTSCAGNVAARDLTRADLDFFAARPLQCPSPGTCADGSDPVECFADPCSVAPACGTPDAVCESNTCSGGCTAEWYGPDDAATCTPW